MRLRVIRIVFNEHSTLGRLYLNNEYYCYTLEDRVRPAGVKVFGETAIPAGTYTVIVNYSPKFKKLMPLLLKVPGFDGIRLHDGLFASHSHGCILTGKDVRSNYEIADPCSAELTNILLESLEEHTIEIVNTKDPL